MLLLLRLLLPRLLLMLRQRLVVVVMVVVPLLQLLPLLFVERKLVAGELVKDGLAAGGLVSGCFCYCGYFYRGRC